MDISALKKTLARAYDTQYSSFYRDKYERVGFRPDVVAAESDWQRVPFVTKEEFIATPYAERLYVPPEDVAIIRTTSGTTGGAVALFPTHIDKLKRMPEALPTDYAPERMMMFFYPPHLVRTSSEHMIAGDTMNLELSAKLARDFRIDSMNIFPQILVSFIPLLKGAGVPLADIRYIRLGGDRTTPWQWEHFFEMFPKAEIQSVLGYAETGNTIGRSCSDAARGGQYLMHPFSRYVYWEIIDSNTAEVLTAEGDEGELAITTIDTVHMAALPLVRYRTGDRARIASLETSCSCKLGGPLFQLLGRAKLDSIRLPAGELKLVEIERVLARFKQYVTGDFELHVTEAEIQNKKRPAAELKLSLKDPDISLSLLAERIAQELRVNASATYADGAAKGLYSPLVCKPLEKASLTAGSKVVRMHDHRT